MRTTRLFRRAVALTAAVALCATASFAVSGIAEGKHFSVIEAASQEDALSIS